MAVSIVGDVLSSVETIRLSTNGMPSMSVQLRLENTEANFYVKDLYDALIAGGYALGQTRQPIVQLGTTVGNQTIKAYMEILEITKEPIIRNEKKFWLIRIEYGFNGKWYYTPDIRRSILQYEKKMDFAYEGGVNGINWTADADDAEPEMRIENTAHDVLDPPITGVATHTILDIRISLPSRENATSSNPGDAGGGSPGSDLGFSPADVDKYVNTVNSDTITVAGITMSHGTAKMLDIQPEPISYMDNEGKRKLWWNVHYRIEYAKEKHYDLRENSGINFLDPDDNYKKKEVRSEGGMAEVQPVPLDTDGSKIDMTASNPEVLKIAYRTLRCIEWKPLGLPEKAADPLINPIQFVSA